MSHTVIVEESAGLATSAEPPPPVSSEAVRICRETVWADALAGDLAGVPLLTSGEARVLLAVLGLPVEARLRWLWPMYFLAVQRADSRRALIRDGSVRKEPEVFEAAFQTERAAQRWLRYLGGSDAVVGDRRLVAELHDWQQQAHRAVVARTSSRKLAKDIQRKAADGHEPLTVCRGHRLRRLPEEVLREAAPDLLEHYGENIVWCGYGDGCGKIVRDTHEPRLPKLYCDACAKKTGNTMNAGLAKTALKRLRAARRFG